MDFFDMNKKFDRVYIEGGETDGAAEVNQTSLVEQCVERKKKGCQYVEHYLLEELKMNKLKLKNDEMTKPSLNGVDDLEHTTVGTGIDIHDLEKHKVHNIYKEYYENKNKPDSYLIIHNYKKKILSLIETNEVTILTGPTGCGKTTQVPQFILDSCIERNKYCNIIVTQPRRIAAISVAKRVCEERGWPLGTLCGYKVGLKNCTSQDTLLTYMTVGVLLQTLIRKKNMNQYTHVILDEIHERDQSMDFTLLVVKKLLSTSQSVKVVLMSATVEAMKFANYFPKLYLGELQCAPIISINVSTTFAVQIHYLDELSALGDLPDINMEEPRISDLNYDICVRLIKQFEKIDNDENRKNSVLVFLPGINEIEYLYSKLTDSKIHSAGAVHYKWSLLPLHSSITTEEQAQVFLPPPTGYRKIILSTNIAESSITVPGVKFVIDFCLTRCLRTDPFSSYSSLQLSWASQANCIQRAGRVGRVMEGRVYRMVYRSFYEDLDEEATPEILTAPLERVVLHSKMLDMGEPKAILALALDPPDLSNIESTILTLKELGGLLRTRRGISTPYDGDLTFLGRLMATLPVDIRITRLIVFGHLFSCLEESIIMGACMSLKSVFSHPFKERLKAYNSKLDWADGSCSDCIAFLNVYEVWCNNHKNGYFKRSKGDNEVSWARRHFIQLRVLKEVKLLVEEITMRLKENLVEESVGIGKVRWNEYQKALVLKVIIAGAFYPNYFGRGIQGGQVDEKSAVKLLGGRNPFTTVYLNNFPHEQPLDLYSQLIKEELSECKEDMKISSDSSSKIYIEFRKRDLRFESGADMPFDGTLPGKIPMAVYRAVKIRQIRKSVNIRVLPLDEALNRAKLLGIKSHRDILKQGEESEINQLIPYNVPGIDVSCVPLIISFMIDPGHFWANDIGNYESQKKVFQVLNSPGLELSQYDKLPAVGEMCIAPYEENGEKWLYRARVESVNKKEKNPTVQVFFVDYGNSGMVNFKELKRYSPQLLKLIGKIPAQAFECVLSEIRPSLMMDSKGNWSEQARVAFEKLIRDDQLFGSIYSVVNGIVSLELFKTDENNKQISINKYLVNKGYAEIIDENYLSKVNNEIRKQRQSEMDQTDLHNNLQQLEFWGVSCIEPPEAKDRKISLQLRGPHSPLEMRIYPYTRSSLGKIVQISDDSVNSVLLDTDPQDSHERLIVAAFINQSPEGSRLTLSNTTVMPNIHGLAAIIPFIFAPEVELRVNGEGTRYTGMLCGLGGDADGNSLFPEHDFEVYFDTDITFEDFTTINSLRFFMSLLLLTEDEPYPNLGFPDIIKFQRKIRSNLLSLLNKQRKSKEVESPFREYVWGLCPCDLVVDNPMAVRYSHLSIFRFHPGISLISDD